MEQQNVTVLSRMKAVAAGHSIVLAGGWNSALFSPQWAAEQLAMGQNVDLEIGTNDPRLPVRLHFDGLYLIPTNDKLLLWPEEVSAESLSNLQRVANSVLEKLPHTPLAAAGVNFRFAVDDPPPELTHIFELADLGALSNHDAQVRETSIRRTLHVQDTDLNLTLDFTRKAELVVDLNFHANVKRADQARIHIGRGIEKYREIALDLLRNVYHLSPRSPWTYLGMSITYPREIMPKFPDSAESGNTFADEPIRWMRSITFEERAISDSAGGPLIEIPGFLRFYEGASGTLRSTFDVRAARMAEIRDLIRRTLID